MFTLFVPGLIVGIILSLVIGPLGSLIIWRKMSSFGDTLAHSSLLGLSLSFYLNVDPFYTIILLLCIISIFIVVLEEIFSLSLNVIYSILSSNLLSIGIILVSVLSGFKKIEVSKYLFGDFLRVTFLDLPVVLILSISILIILFFQWKNILLMTINSELAKLDGVNLIKTRLILVLTIAVTIGISIKFVGSLIITALLIIPAATAQKYVSTPVWMCCFATLISIISIFLGMYFSIIYMVPSSPSIVLSASIIFLVSSINVKKIINQILRFKL